MTFELVSGMARGVHKGLAWNFGQTGESPTCLLLANRDGRYQPVRFDGMPSREEAVAVASDFPTQALVLTAACWTAEAAPAAARRRLDRLRLPKQLPAEQRGEALVTTAVLHGHPVTFGIISRLTRDAGGLTLEDPVESEQLLDRSDGIRAFLADVLSTVAPRLSQQ